MSDVKFKNVSLGNGWTIDLPEAYSAFKSIENTQSYTVLDEDHTLGLIFSLTDTSIQIHDVGYDSNPLIDFKDKKITINVSEDHFEDD
ncbi:hypothetical protein NIE88_12645 [Sporolactobacillus shoreicorticis]|uniref:Uncharacterized protein n=1 Tax=Sporolactobacillus shoreicorticis TaxID=1923877 RepID=A0ABW5S8A1_9BACL|nr:hypothetical protein [Sporolactobacillus shoreicorticis]MCO7126613.1 hypothetical protein [Sporolactobacillus shoreicorticis]